MPTLADVPESVESRITRLFLGKIREDAYFSAVFDPIRLVENPTREALASYSNYSMVVQTFTVKPSDNPSKRQTFEQSIVLSFYLPEEQTSEDSDLYWLRLYNKVRIFSYGLQVLVDPATSEQMNFATTRVEPLQPLQPLGTATVILSYAVIFETDIDPTTGNLI